MSSSYALVVGMIAILVSSCGPGYSKSMNSNSEDQPGESVESNQDNGKSRDEITITIIDRSAKYTVKLGEDRANLGNAISQCKQKEPLDADDIVVLKKKSKNVYMPWFFAASTNARKSLIHDGDTIQFTKLGLLQLNKNNEVLVERAHKIFEKHKSFDRSIGRSIPNPGFEFAKSNEQISFVDKANLLRQLKIAKSRKVPKYIDRYTKILGEYEKEIGDDRAKISATGILKNGDTKLDLSVFSFLKDAYQGRLEATSNKAKANIIVLERGRNHFLIPLKAELSTTKVPDSVMAASSVFWNNQFVANEDHLHFTRLDMYEPVSAALKKQP